MNENLMEQLSYRKKQLAAFNVKIEELGISAKFKGLTESYANGPNNTARGLDEKMEEIKN